jgi:STAS domain-containing protein
MLRLRLMKQPGSGLAWLAFQLTASIRVAGAGAWVRMWAMRNALALIAIVDPAAGVATARVRGEFGPFDYARLRDDLLWVAANCPRRLVLDLGVCDRFTEQLIAVIAAARRQLPEGCLLEVRSARPAVRNLLERAGWTGVRVMAAGRPEAERHYE